jgi:hypothetical protein
MVFCTPEDFRSYDVIFRFDVSFCLYNIFSWHMCQLSSCTCLKLISTQFLVEALKLRDGLLELPRSLGLLSLTMDDIYDIINFFCTA